MANTYVDWARNYIEEQLKKSPPHNVDELECLIHSFTDFSGISETKAKSDIANNPVYVLETIWKYKDFWVNEKGRYRQETRFWLIDSIVRDHTVMSLIPEFKAKFTAKGE